MDIEYSAQVPAFAAFMASYDIGFC
jgi:hypothetical protein